MVVKYLTLYVEEALLVEGRYQEPEDGRCAPSELMLGRRPSPVRNGGAVKKNGIPSNFY